MKTLCKIIFLDWVLSWTKFSNILVECDTQFDNYRCFCHRSLEVLLAEYAFISWSTVSVLPDLAWLSRFLQQNWNFSIYLATVLWSTSLKHNKCFFVFSLTLWSSLNSKSMLSRFKLHCPFISVAFKSHTKWNNAKQFRASTTTILPTTALTALVMGHKLSRIKIRQNFSSSLILCLRTEYNFYKRSIFILT